MNKWIKHAQLHAITQEFQIKFKYNDSHSTYR